MRKTGKISPSQKHVLALDLGTKTGWAMAPVLYSTHEMTVCGTANFASSRFEGGGMRYLRFRNWLLEGFNNGIERIVFEEVRSHAGVDAAHVYGGLMAHLLTLCDEREIPCMGVPVGTIKKHITGSGGSNKKKVMDAVAKLGNFGNIDDNAADAIALLDYVLKGNC